jgi:hypothetical protein
MMPVVMRAVCMAAGGIPTVRYELHGASLIYRSMVYEMCAADGVSRRAWRIPPFVGDADRAEIFFGTADNSYFHLAFNCFANGTAGTYDALKTDRKWNCQWDVKTKQADGEWLAVVTIPLKDLKITVEQNNRVRAFFSRTRSAQGNFDSDAHSSWAGAVPHNVKAFGELEFELE